MLDFGLLDFGLLDFGLLDVGLLDVGLLDVGLPSVFSKVQRPMSKVYRPICTFARRFSTDDFFGFEWKQALPLKNP